MQQSFVLSQVTVFPVFWEVRAMLVKDKKTLAHYLLFAGALALTLNYVFYWVLNLGFMRLPIRIAAVVFFSLSSLMNFKSLRFDVLFVPMVAISCICVLLHGSDALNMLAVLLFVLAVSPYSFNEALDILFKCFLISAVVYLLALATGSAIITTTSHEGRIRNNLGFSQVNAASLFFLPLLLLLYKKDKHFNIKLLSVAVFFISLYALTNTRSVLLSVFIFIFFYIIFLLMRKIKNLVPLQRIVGIVLLYLVVVAAFVLSLFANSEIDSILSYRPTYFFNALSNLSPIEWIFGSDAFIEVDNSYLVMVGHYGLPFLICAVAVLHKAILRSAEMGDLWTLSFIIAIVVIGSIESFLYRPELIVTLVFWAIAFKRADYNFNDDSGSKPNQI